MAATMCRLLSCGGVSPAGAGGSEGGICRRWNAHDKSPKLVDDSSSTCKSKEKKHLNLVLKGPYTVKSLAIPTCSTHPNYKERQEEQKEKLLSLKLLADFTWKMHVYHHSWCYSSSVSPRLSTSRD
jgi:hypothetical protein